MPLADPNAPVEITVKNGKRFVSLPSKLEAEQIVHNTKRKIADLPDIPDRMNPISAVIAYELFGLDREEIAIALGLTIYQINQICSTEAFDKMRQVVLSNIQKQSVDEVKTIFQEHAKTAANKIVEHVGSNSALISMQAAGKVLSYAGYSPEEARVNPMDTGLTIKIYNGDKDVRD